MRGALPDCLGHESRRRRRHHLLVGSTRTQKAGPSLQRYAFAAVKQDGSVVTWGHAHHGCNSGEVKSELTGGVDHVIGTSEAFAAVKQDGSVVTWGHAHHGCNSGEVKSELTGGVDHVIGTSEAFATFKQEAPSSNGDTQIMSETPTA